MLTYEIKQQEDNSLCVYIYDDNHTLLVVQPFNPYTGENFKDENDAKEWAESYIKYMTATQKESTNQDKKSESNDIYLSIEYQDKNGQPLKVTQVGTPVIVKVELYKKDDKGQKQYLPLNGSYIVPYYKDEVMAGATIIDVNNGQGAGILTFKESGIYTIKLNKVLNAETMKQPSPLPKLSDDPKLIVVEPLESAQPKAASNTSASNTTSTNITNKDTNTSA